MTCGELAHSLHRIAEALERLPTDARLHPGEAPGLDGDAALGAARIIWYLRALFTATPKELFSRGEILVILDEIQADPEIMTPNLVYTLDHLEDEAGNARE